MLLEEAGSAWVSQSHGDGVYTSATSPPDPPPPTNNTQLQRHLLPSAGTVVPEPAPPLPTTGRQQGHDRNYPLSQLHLQLPQANGASPRPLPPSTTPLTEHPSHQDHEKRPPRRLNDRQGRKRRHGTVRERIHPIPHQRRSPTPLIPATPPPNQAPRLTHVSPHSRRHRLLLRAPHHLRRRHPRRDAQHRLRKLRRGPPTLSPRLQSTEGRPLPEVEGRGTGAAAAHETVALRSIPGTASTSSRALHAAPSTSSTNHRQRATPTLSHLLRVPARAQNTPPSPNPQPVACAAPPEQTQPLHQIPPLVPNALTSVGRTDRHQRVSEDTPFIAHSTRKPKYIPEERSSLHGTSTWGSK